MKNEYNTLDINIKIRTSKDTNKHESHARLILHTSSSYPGGSAALVTLTNINTTAKDISFMLRVDDSGEGYNIMVLLMCARVLAGLRSRSPDIEHAPIYSRLKRSSETRISSSVLLALLCSIEGTIILDMVQ